LTNSVALFLQDESLADKVIATSGWIKLGFGMSYNQILASPYVVSGGFRFATETDLISLYAAVGISLQRKSEKCECRHYAQKFRFHCHAPSQRPKGRRSPA
jgi:hypothetical protein